MPTSNEEPWDARFHLDEILDFVQKWRGARSLHFFDMYSGAGMASKTFKKFGYSCETYEIEDNPTEHDVTSERGFYCALALVLALFPSALILCGPPCGLWIWISQSVHQRTTFNTVGDIGKHVVRCANTLVRNTILLLTIAHWRGVYYIIEQPKSSKMEHFPWMASLISALKLKRLVTWMRAFGHDIPKPSYLVSNLPGATALRRVWSKKRSFQRQVAWIVSSQSNISDPWEDPESRTPKMVPYTTIG